jgi:hypothetical protein
VRYVSTGDSKNAPARGARGGNASPDRAERYSSVSPARDVRRRDLAIPPEPSAVTGDGIQRSSAVPSVRSAPGLGQITGRGGPGRGADAAEPHVPAANAHARFAARMSRGETDFCHISTARSGAATTAMSHRRGQDHGRVTSWWLPGRRRVASTPYGVGIGRYTWRQGNPRDARDKWCRVGSGGEVARGGAGTNKRRPGRKGKRPVPSRNRPRCARNQAGRLGSGGALEVAGARGGRPLGLGGGFG